MSRLTFLTPIAILIGAMLLSSLLITTRPQAEQIAAVPEPLLVEVMEVHKESLQIDIQAHGVVVPRTQTTLTSEVSGRVMQVSAAFTSGGFFRRGDLLLRIDDRRYQAQLKRAEADVARAESQLAQERGMALVAKQEWQQRANRDHIDPDSKALALRQPQLLQAQAALLSAQAALQEAQNDLQNTRILAPYDGLVRQKQVDVGQFVSTGSALAQTFAVDRVEIRLAIPENKLPYLALPSLHQQQGGTDPVIPVRLSNQVGGEAYQWQGQLVRSEGVLDERSRALFVVAEVEDPYGLQHSSSGALQPLRVGTFVDASIDGGHQTAIIELPRHVLRPGNKVWVVDGNQQLQERQVEILQLQGTQLYVSAGLDEGDLVCLTHMTAALPGTKVRLSLPVSELAQVQP